MKRHLFIINVLLITAIVYLGVNMFYKISVTRLDQVPFSKSAVNAESVSQSEPERPLSAYDPIIRRNLFNTIKGAGGRPKQVDIESLKPTSLNLKLLGTVTGDEKKAYAVIQDPRETYQQLYRIGDTIQNATLKLILREKVVLRVNGKDEVLEIEDAQSRPQKTERRQRFAKITSQNVSLERSDIEESVKNINNLMKQVRVRPHFTNGKPDGLRLTGIKPNSIFNKMGIRNGDVITGVDGKNIKSVDDALKLYQSLQSAASVQLQLKRRGRMKTIDYYIK